MLLIQSCGHCRTKSPLCWGTESSGSHVTLLFSRMSLWPDKFTFFLPAKKKKTCDLCDLVWFYSKQASQQIKRTEGMDKAACDSSTFIKPCALQADAPSAVSYLLQQLQIFYDLCTTSVITMTVSADLWCVSPSTQSVFSCVFFISRTDHLFLTCVSVSASTFPVLYCRFFFLIRFCFGLRNLSPCVDLCFCHKSTQHTESTA